MDLNSTGAEGALSRGARASFAVHVVLACGLAVLAAVAVLALVATLSYKTSLRADLTRNARYALTPSSRELLRALDRDVRVRFVYGRDADIMRRTLDLAGQPREEVYTRHYRGLVEEIARRVQTVLNEWGNASRRIYVEVADADYEPKRVMEWAVAAQRKPDELVNRVVLSCGDEERVVPLSRFVGVDWGHFPKDPREPAQPPRLDGKWRVQAELLEALKGVSAGAKVRLWLPEGKRARVEADGESFAYAKSFLRGQGFEAFPWNPNSGPPIDGIVLLAAPGASLSIAENAALKSFEAGGGRLLLCADPRQAEDFGAVLEPYGLRFEAAKIEDAQNVLGNSAPDMLRSSRLFSGKQEIVAPFLGRSPLVMDRSRPILDEGLKAPGALREPILRASAEAVAVPAEYDPKDGTATFVTGAKRGAAHAMLGAACERTVASGALSRVVVIGSADFLEAGFLGAGVNLANRDLLLNALNWLAERSTAPGAPEPDLPGARVALTPEFDRFLSVSALFLLPGALALIGVFVYFRRRN